MLDAHRRALAGPDVDRGGWSAEWEEMRGPGHEPTPTLLVRRRLAVEQALEVLADRERCLLLDWVDVAELSERYGGSVQVLQVRVGDG